MYAKFLEIPSNEETIYECDIVNFPAHDESVWIEHGRKVREIDVSHISGSTLTVYVMNEQGKTIAKRKFAKTS